MNETIIQVRKLLHIGRLELFLLLDCSIRYLPFGSVSPGVTKEKESMEDSRTQQTL